MRSPGRSSGPPLGHRGQRRPGDLCAHYGVSTGTLHSADADVLATLDLLAAIVAAHPGLGATDLDDVHTMQVEAHRRWAESFNAWRDRKGLSGEGATTHWPMRGAASVAQPSAG